MLRRIEVLEQQVSDIRGNVEQDVMEKLREFDIEMAADTLAKEGFKKLRTLKRMEDDDVDKLGLPKGTAIDLKDLLASLRDTPAAGDEPVVTSSEPAPAPKPDFSVSALFFVAVECT